MGDHLKKVRSGDPLKIPAATYNAFVDAARYVRNRQEVGGVSPAARTPGTVLVRNASAALVQRHYVLGITGVEMDPTSSLPIAYSDPVMTCNTPTANHMGRFVVTAQPIPPGELGWAYIDGVCWTKVIVQTGMEAYEYADPYEGLTVGLVAVVEGSAKILWKPAGVGLLWAVVRLGVGSSIQVRPVKVYNDGGASGGYDEGTFATRGVTMGSSALPISTAVSWTWPRRRFIWLVNEPAVRTASPIAPWSPIARVTMFSRARAFSCSVTSLQLLRMPIASSSCCSAACLMLIPKRSSTSPEPDRAAMNRPMASSSVMLLKLAKSSASDSSRWLSCRDSLPPKPR
ncbi:MAG: hypothetical protein GX591_15480, partial [Planctomycetes bacterium]|nr:hypothetical protein [Planctomycetota bacterium]